MSLKQFKIGKLVSGEWIGDEAVLGINMVAGFTYKAETNIVALQISIEDFHQKIPKDWLETMQYVSNHKREFIAKRMVDITATSQNV